MRDPKRIPQMLELIQQGWEKVPDWRFGQLIENLRRYSGVGDLFYVEDDDMVEIITVLFGLEEKHSD